MLDVKGVARHIVQLEYLIEYFKSIGIDTKELESFLDKVGRKAPLTP